MVKTDNKQISVKQSAGGVDNVNRVSAKGKVTPNEYPTKPCNGEVSVLLLWVM